MTATQVPQRDLSRRTLVKGAAWSVPAIAVGASANAVAASCTDTSTDTVAFVGDMNPTSAAGTLRPQAANNNWFWRASAWPGFRLSYSMLRRYEAAGIGHAGANVNQIKLMNYYPSGGYSTKDSAPTVGKFEKTGASPDSALGRNYFVFQGDPSHPAPTSNTGENSLTFMAIHSKPLPLCAGRTYTFTLDVWSDTYYAHNLRGTLGFVSADGAADSGVPTSIPTYRNATAPSVWLGTTDTYQNTRWTKNEKDPKRGAGKNTLTITYTPTSSQTVMILFKVVAGDAPEPLTTGQPVTINTGALGLGSGTISLRMPPDSEKSVFNDLAVANPVLTIS
ncbi:hypothetical protein [Actinomyces faecalis]|uniref:hypothetical protein n=1 Tax=Actinomyces faecalis TaxID=2722820 RepID=UPI00155164D7|nr:hypothetical protein [Actinomyces faecalis]